MLLALFGLLLFSAANDLWLDEILSLSIARGSEFWGAVFSNLSDNNHILNTLWMRLVSAADLPILYRLLSVFCGLGSILLARRLALRTGNSSAQLLTTLLMGLSYPMILYFSEARGYAIAILMSLACYAALLNKPENKADNENGWKNLLPGLLLFWTASAIGILGHATFVMITLSLLIWDIYRSAASKSVAGRAAMVRVMATHLPVLLLTAVWYFGHLKKLIIAGGPIYGLDEIIGRAASMLTGLPDQPFWRGIGLSIVFIFAFRAILFLKRSGDSRWVLFLSVLCLAPMAMTLAARPQFLYFRYYLVCFPFFLMLAAEEASRALQEPRRAENMLCLTLILICLALQLPRLQSLISSGRGNYSSAIRHILKTTDGSDPIALGSDHDFRNGWVFGYHSGRLKGADRIMFLSRSQEIPKPLDWYILHTQDLNFQPQPKLFIENFGAYLLDSSFESAPVSGWRWFLYRKEK